MTTPSFPTIWYWVVGDTNPTTQAFESLSGTFVSNGSAAYQSWIANGGQLYNPSSGAKQIKVTGAVNNGSGLIRLTVDTTSQMATNDAWVVQNVGGTTEANGTWQITVINPTTVDLQGSAFVHAFTSNGVIDRGTVIDTAAHLYSVLNSLGLSLLPTPSGFYSKNVLLINSNTTLANPLSEVTSVTNNGGVVDLILPPMNATNSVPIGFAFYVSNNAGSTGNIRVMANDDATLIFSIRPGYVGIFINTDNSTINGSVSLIGLSLSQGGGVSGAEWQVLEGGTGRFTLTSGGTLYGLGGQPIGATAVGTFGQEYSQSAFTGNPAWTNPGFSHGDSDWGMPSGASSGRIRVYYTSAALTAARTWTLPAANAFALGSEITIADLVGGLTSAHTISLARAGADTINGGSVSVVLGEAYAWARLVTDGVSAWEVIGGRGIISGPGRLASTDLSDLPIPLASGGTGAAKNNYINVGLSAAVQTIASGGLGSDILFDLKTSDADGVYTAASGKYQPNVAGNFLVTVGTQWNTALGDGVTFGAAVFKNGGEWVFSLNFTGSGSANASQSAVAIVSMNGTTDFITARAFQQSGANQNLQNLATRTFMQAQRLPS